MLETLRAWLPRGQSLPEELWRGRHLGILVVLWLHVVAIPIFATVRGYGILHGLAECTVVALPAVAASWPHLNRRMRTLASSLGLLSSSAVLVHLSGGVIEMHFHFFVMVALVALYQDWLPFLASIGYVFIHHGLMGSLDARSVYNHVAAWRHPWRWAIIHAIFIVGISAVCLVTWRLNENLLAVRRRVEDRLRQETQVVEALHRVGRTLAAELDLKRVVQAVTDAGTELSEARFGAFFYNVVDGDGESYMLYTLSGVPAEAFERFPLPRNSDVFRPTFEGEGPVRIDDVQADRRYGNNPPYYGMPKGHLPVRSYLAVPVTSRDGGVIGGLFFGHPDRGVFTEIHERIILGIAAQAAVAIDNARLYESERMSRLASESAKSRLTLLAEVSTVLTSSLETTEILQGVADRIAPAIADYCTFDLVTPAGSIERVAVAGAPPPGGSFASLRQSPDIEDPTTPAVRALVTAMPVVEPAAIAVPLSGRQGVLGALSVGSFDSSPRTVAEGDLPLLEELSRRAAAAVENAQLYARQRSVAETLQHALLPDRLPDVPGMTATARYISGGSGVDVGGDWYDVIRMSGGAIGLAMGDVVGRGERAASLMGQLRNAARAYALDGKAPADIAMRLNQMLLEVGSDSMATMFYAILDPGTGTIRAVNAGHPPPLVIGPAEDVSFLEGDPAVPLGTSTRARYHETVTSLQAGSTLVLYTDGLVEDRRTSLDDGFDLLRDAATNGPDGLDALCDHLLATCLEGRGAEDDVAILAVRLTPLGTDLHLHLPRDPAIVAPLRSTLRRWLTAAGASEQEIFEIVVATGEACANAIQHAVGPRAASFRLDGRVDETVTIQIRDTGRWREPRANTRGGRGITIMNTLMDDVEIQTGKNGTEVTLVRRLRAREPEGAGT